MPGDSSRSKARALKKSAFTCEACRKRKVKCDGKDPCSRCAARGEACEVALPPTLSYTKVLEQRIAALEAELAYSQSSKSNTPGDTGNATSAGSSPSSSAKDPSHADHDVGISLHLEGLKLKDDGGTTFHGPTSFFQLPDNRDADRSALSRAVSNMESKERLMNNAWRERAYEQFANISEPFKSLLDLHWCWIQPLFNFVYRPAFTRDMKSNGPFYSPMLMSAMMSHSVRWCRADPRVSGLLESFDGGRKFFESSLTETFEEIRLGHARITTIQTLLLLSAQECGRANRTQAWLYAGMAFRLVEDMGIGIDSRQISGEVQISEEEIEIRNRLYWSCFLWENILCLYLGRTPVLQISAVSPPKVLLDDTAELEMWVPHGIDPARAMEYPQVQAYSISCFMRMCSLAQILHEILIQLYDPRQLRLDVRMQAWIEDRARQLQSWWDDLPDHLRMLPTSLPESCPPNHIAVLNCLFHTIKILLHRPMLCSKALVGENVRLLRKEHAMQCLSSANAIVAIYSLFCRSFGAQYTITSLAYSIYTAASIFLLEVRTLETPTFPSWERLAFCVQALEHIVVTSPIVETSLRLIYAELERCQISLHHNQGARSLVATSTDPGSNENQELQSGDPWDAGDAIIDSSVLTSNFQHILDTRSEWWLDQDANLVSVEISPELLEALSHAEPVSISIGAGASFVNGGLVMPKQGKSNPLWLRQPAALSNRYMRRLQPSRVFGFEGMQEPISNLLEETLEISLR